MKKNVKKALRLLFAAAILMMALGFACGDDSVYARGNTGIIGRDVVLVLDRSGSMEGEPLAQTQAAALKFLDRVFEDKVESRVSIVSYDTYAQVGCGLTQNRQELASCIENLYPGDMTNMYAGLEEADRMLQTSTAKRKIIVLMSDGLPNEGVSDGDDYASPLIRYADDMKNRGYYIYTMGFFMSVEDDMIFDAQQLMEKIASPRLHYEVSSAEDLVFFFEDIANQISGTQYVYIRIVCPADVMVSYNGEVLSSKAGAENTRTSFGTLTYENTQPDGQNGSGAAGEMPDLVKILRLNMKENYDVQIEGYGSGTMDYIVCFPNENGEYKDVRHFPSIEITPSTKILSNTDHTDPTYLKVDKDGDGSADVTYRTDANGEMEEVEDRTILYILIAIAAGVAILIVLTLIILFTGGSRQRRRESEGMAIAAMGEIYGVSGAFQGRSYPMNPGRQCVVGRKAICDIRLSRSEVSRVHCVIQMLPNGMYQVTDHSLNGTFYNNQRLQNRETYHLPRGAQLVLGDEGNILELR